VTHCREAVRDENGSGMACGGQNPLEDLRYPPDVKLRRGFVQ
jgi:hypothetical protein